MENTQSFLIDVINLMPQGTDCFIQAPSLENEILSNLLRTSNFDYYKVLTLTPDVKGVFIQEILTRNVEQYINSLECRFNNKLLFEGYDSLEFGILSKDVPVPDNFLQNYVNGDMCVISQEW